MNKLFRPITEEMRHTVATLVALSVPTNSITTRCGATLNAINRIKSEPHWETLLASKKAALEQLMRGAA